MQKKKKKEKTEKEENLKEGIERHHP